jgi:hypothetical protein
LHDGLVSFIARVEVAVTAPLLLALHYNLLYAFHLFLQVQRFFSIKPVVVDDVALLAVVPHASALLFTPPKLARLHDAMVPHK